MFQQVAATVLTVHMDLKVKVSCSYCYECRLVRYVLVVWTDC